MRVICRLDMYFSKSSLEEQPIQLDTSQDHFQKPYRLKAPHDMIFLYSFGPLWFYDNT